MNFVAISLPVSTEMVKFAQGYFMECDWLMYDEEKDMLARNQSSNLNEELGCINYVFSDKTGTLTKNIMDFKKFSAGFKSYGQSDNSNNHVDYAEGVSNVNFYDEEFKYDWRNTQSENHQNLVNLVNILAICQTIIVQNKEGKMSYNASSPDELALTNAARHFGVIFEARDEDNRIVIFNKKENKRYYYKLLNVIEFTSLRKRMTVIVQDEISNKILCITKGADSVIQERLHKG